MLSDEGQAISYQGDGRVFFDVDVQRKCAVNAILQFPNLE